MRAAPRPRLQDTTQVIGVVRSYAADQAIFFEGDLATHFILVMDGLVRSCNIFADGRRFIGAFFASGDMFGFECHPTYQATAEAVCETTLVFYPARHPMVAGGLPGQSVGSMMLCIGQARDHARLLGRFSAMEKLSAFLVECSARSKVRDHITLEMRRQDIADYLGLTVETVSRCLARLKRDRMIEFVSSRHLKLLDLVTLRAINS
jgi:CRP/FNR family nitrogen fixation transcriptional regulator